MATSINQDPMEGTSKSFQNINPKTTSKINNPNKYYHYFNYNLNETLLKKPLMEIINIYEEIIGITPANSYMIEKSTIHFKLITIKETIHTVDTIKRLRNKGFNLKLSSNQMNRNSIFCTQAPSGIRDMTKEDVINDISSQNKDLTILDIYIPPSNNNTSTGIKISLLTQAMVNQVLENGLKILANQLDDSQITRAKILKTIQCTKCYKYGHGLNTCKSPFKVCPHCTKNHNLKECNYKEDSPKCCNCGKDHRASSNKCNIRKKYIGIPKNGSDKAYNFITNPESNINEHLTYYPAPPPTFNPWKKTSKPKYWGDEDDLIEHWGSTSDNNISDSELQVSPPQSPSAKNNNYTVLKHKKKPVPRHNAIAEAVYQRGNPSNLINNQNNSNTISQNNSSKPPPTAITPPNQPPPRASPNHQTDKIINITNVLPNPKISYHEVFMMAKNFIDWRYAFVELQRVFNLDIVEIPEKLSELLIRDDGLSINTSSPSDRSSVKSNAFPSPSSKNTSPNTTLESENSNDSELEDLNCTIKVNNSHQISDEISATNNHQSNSPTKLSKNENTNISNLNSNSINNSTKTSEEKLTNMEINSLFRSYEEKDLYTVENKNLASTGAIPKFQGQDITPDLKIKAGSHKLSISQEAINCNTNNSISKNKPSPAQTRSRAKSQS